MNKKLKQLFFKITASILAFIFLIADVSWASPPTQNSQDYNLAVPSRCQQQPINAETPCFQRVKFWAPFLVSLNIYLRTIFLLDIWIRFSPLS